MKYQDILEKLVSSNKLIGKNLNNGAFFSLDKDLTINPGELMEKFVNDNNLRIEIFYVRGIIRVVMCTIPFQFQCGNNQLLVGNSQLQNETFNKH